MSVNVITFETAQKLKAADFPYPEPGDSQFWYSIDGRLVLIKEEQGKLFDCYPETEELRHSFDIGKVTCDGAFFCPTIEDFERELQGSQRWNLKPVGNPVFTDKKLLPNLEEYAQIWLEKNAGKE